MSTENPQLIPPEPPKRNATVQADAPDFVETPDVVSHPADDRESLPLWLYLVCGFALFMAGSSFTGLGRWGLYDSGGGGAIVASSNTEAVSKPLTPMEMGKVVYGGNCANCHQATGEGQPGAYPPLAGSEWVMGGDERLAAIMLHGLEGNLTVKGASFGTQQMPAWSQNLTDEKIADVLTYIRSSWGNTAPPVTPDQITAFRAEFAAHADTYTQAALLKMPPKK